MPQPPFSTVEQAVAALRRGALVGMPTETVYGLAADARNELAVRRIFAAKGRPSNHPVIVHFVDSDTAWRWAKNVPEHARRLAAAFWPGPLTLVLERALEVRDVITGGQNTVGLRVPAHPLAHALLAQFGDGVAAPSANRHGRLSPTSAEDVAEELGAAVDEILDGGPCQVGIESTIIDLSGGEPTLLRPGGVPVEAIEAVLQRPVLRTPPPTARAPGLLRSHYAPKAGVVTVLATQLATEAKRLARGGQRIAVLSHETVPALPGMTHFPMPSPVEQFAQRLYPTLRQVDREGFDVALVATPSAEGIGLAVLDRLARASAPRPDDAPKK
ncbi:MAG: L-threonylcarbamoyladenylate synthase [Myxococcaceae bacterium]